MFHSQEVVTLRRSLAVNSMSLFEKRMRRVYTTRRPVLQETRVTRREMVSMIVLQGGTMHVERTQEQDKNASGNNQSSDDSSIDTRQQEDASTNSDTRRRILQLEKTMRTRSLVDSMWQSLE